MTKEFVKNISYVGLPTFDFPIPGHSWTTWLLERVESSLHNKCFLYLVKLLEIEE